MLLPCSCLNFPKMCVLECDALGTGVGAVLLQGHPLAFFRKALSNKVGSFSSHIRKLLAMVLAIDKWRESLLGSKFEVHADHESLKHLWGQQITTPQQCWLVKLMAYDFVIILARQGKQSCRCVVQAR